MPDTRQRTRTARTGRRTRTARTAKTDRSREADRAFGGAKPPGMVRRSRCIMAETWTAKGHQVHCPAKAPTRAHAIVAAVGGARIPRRCASAAVGRTFRGSQEWLVPRAWRVRGDLRKSQPNLLLREPEGPDGGFGGTQTPTGPRWALAGVRVGKDHRHSVRRMRRSDGPMVHRSSRWTAWTRLSR